MDLTPDEVRLIEERRAMTSIGGSPEGPRHPAVAEVLRFFTFAHLPGHLQVVSRRFYDLAINVADDAPHSRETTVALRKLLEAKDAAVRAVIEASEPSPEG